MQLAQLALGMTFQQEAAPLTHNEQGVNLTSEKQEFASLLVSALPSVKALQTDLPAHENGMVAAPVTNVEFVAAPHGTILPPTNFQAGLGGNSLPQQAVELAPAALITSELAFEPEILDARAPLRSDVEPSVEAGSQELVEDAAQDLRPSPSPRALHSPAEPGMAETRKFPQAKETAPVMRPNPSENPTAPSSPILAELRASEQKPAPLEVPVSRTPEMVEPSTAKPVPLDVPIARTPEKGDMGAPKPAPLDVPVFRTPAKDDTLVQKPQPLEVPVSRTPEKLEMVVAKTEPSSVPVSRTPEKMPAEATPPAQPLREGQLVARLVAEDRAIASDQQLQIRTALETKAAAAQASQQASAASLASATVSQGTATPSPSPAPRSEPVQTSLPADLLSDAAQISSKARTPAPLTQAQPSPGFVSAQPTIANASPSPLPVGDTMPALRDTAPLERLVETVSQMREAGQAGRGELALKHAEFGTISMRVAANEGELQARLSSRDPGFVVAAQNALAERSVAASQEASFNSSRQNDGSSTNEQNQSRLAGNQSDQSQRQQAQDGSGTAPTRGEHGERGLSADDHIPSTRANAGGSNTDLFA